MKIELDLSNYATKSEVKKSVDTSQFAKRVDLSSLKSEIDKLDIDKLKPVPTDLSKLSNVVDNDVIKNTAYDNLV